MSVFIITNGDDVTAEVGKSILSLGGNAVDAVVAAGLAWPLALGSSGALLADGLGSGRLAYKFPAYIPGLGLSRPRRVQLLEAAAPPAHAAVPCVAQGMAATLARWGTMEFDAIIQRVSEKSIAHERVLRLLRQEGVGSFSKGAWALAAVQSLGPIHGGLFTRRDLIEARPVSLDVQQISKGNWLSCPQPDELPDDPSFLEGGALPSRRWFGAIARDRFGMMGSLVLDAGPQCQQLSPIIEGVEINTLMAEAFSSATKKVGRPLPSLFACALSLGDGPRAACGSVTSLHSFLVAQTHPTSKNSSLGGDPDQGRDGKTDVQNDSAGQDNARQRGGPGVKDDIKAEDGAKRALLFALLRHGGNREVFGATAMAEL